MPGATTKRISLWVREDYVKQLIIHAIKRGVYLNELMADGLPDILLNEHIYPRTFNHVEVRLPNITQHIFDALHIEDRTQVLSIAHIAVEKLVYKLQYAPGLINSFGERDRFIKGSDGPGRVFEHNKHTKRLSPERFHELDLDAIVDQVFNEARNRIKNP